MTKQQPEAALQSIRSRPHEDQEELLQVARDIEARRIGIYRATAAELAEIDEADRTRVATQQDVEAAERVQ